MIKNKFLKIILLPVLLFALFLQPVFGEEIFSVEENIPLAGSITYSKKKLLDPAGWVDVYAAIADTSDSKIEAAPIRAASFGKKQSVQKMADESYKKIFAAVNASFFDVKKSLADPYGFEADEGIVSLPQDLNRKLSDKASLILTTDGVYRIIYFRPGELYIQNESGYKVNLAGVNRLNLANYSALFNEKAFKDSSYIDKSGKYYKIAVSGDIAVKLAKPGENVAMPEGGYIVAVPEKNASTIKEAFKEGTAVKLHMGENFPIDKIKTAVSGGGMIMKNGSYVSEGLQVSAKYRNPRTAAGLSADGKKLIILAVDGRGTSKGVNNQEMAEILKSYGATEAMSFDGGGSTTMITRGAGDFETKLENSPSDGAQRSVINGLAIRAVHNGNKLTKLHLTAGQDYAYVGQSVPLVLKGTDEFEAPFDMKGVNAEFVVDSPETAYISGNNLVAKSAGKVTVYAKAGDASSEKLTFDIFDKLIGFEMAPKILEVKNGASASFDTAGILPNGEKIKLDLPVTSSLDNQTIGVLNGKSFSQTGGSGFGRAIFTYNDMTASAGIFAGDSKLDIIKPADLKPDIKFRPSNKMSAAKILESPHLKIKYFFKKSNKPQTIDVNLGALQISEQQRNLEFNLTGDGKPLFINAYFSSVDGKKFFMPLVSSKGFSGETFRLALQKNLNYPVKLEKFEITTGELIDNLAGAFEINSIKADLSKNEELLKTLPLGKINDPYFKEGAGEPVINIGAASVPAQEPPLAPIFGNEKPKAILNGGNRQITGFENQNGADFTLIKLNSSGNSLFSNDKYALKKLKNVLSNSADNVVILSQTDPNDLQNENEAYALKTYLSQMSESKNIYYFSLDNSYSNFSADGGVKYIRLTDRDSLLIYSGDGGFSYIVR